MELELRHTEAICFVSGFLVWKKDLFALFLLQQCSARCRVAVSARSGSRSTVPLQMAVVCYLIELVSPSELRAMQSWERRRFTPGQSEQTSTLSF
jgi:hypothetical protein